LTPAAVLDPARSAYAAPIAAALIGLAGGLVIAIAAALGATSFVAAALGVLALVLITGGQAESMLAARSDRRTAAPAFRFGVIAIAVVVLLRTGAIDALLDLWRLENGVHACRRLHDFTRRGIDVHADAPGGHRWHRACGGAGRE
jgi:hypothetical protein